MKLKFWWVILIFLIPKISFSQEVTPTLNIGDKAPPMRLSTWVKGSPIQKFEKGKVYVIEFWATWCIPCKAAMPRLSVLAEKYSESVSVIGVDIFEKPKPPIEKIKKFVDSMGQQMNYKVAIQDSNFMETDWLMATGNIKSGIPLTFVVNKDGRLAWIGHPRYLEKILPQIVNNTWDIKAEITKRNLDRRLQKLDRFYNEELNEYRGDDRYDPPIIGQPDAALLAIAKIIKDEPALTYAPAIGHSTFVSLLKTNQQKAFEYGAIALEATSYNYEPGYNIIIDGITSYSNKIPLSANLYQLGAEAYQLEIDDTPYPETVPVHKHIHKMATWYWKANNKLKAIEAEEAAIKDIKNRVGFDKTKLEEYEADLEKYKN